MKKSLLFAAALTMLFASCTKNNDEVKTLKAEFTLETVSELPYGEPVQLSGSFTSTTAISKAVFTGAKKAEDGTFTVVGEAQEGTIEGTTASVDFFADSKEIDAIEVVLSASGAAKKFYFDAPKVTGEPKGDVWFNDAVALYADNKVENHENNPEKYPEEFTGAGSDTKSFFSMHGVKVNGKVEHILSLNDILPVDGKDVSFCFANVLRKTTLIKPEETGLIGSQRGYTFCTVDKLSAGTVGRQCDIYQYGEHKLDKTKAETDKVFKMQYIRGEWGWGEKEELFKAVDAIFFKLKNPTTNLEKIKAFYALGEIQRKLDNSTLGETDPEKVTNIGGSGLLRKLLNAGEGESKAIKENYRTGDYIVFRSERKKEGEENPRYYYGIMQIQLFEGDDSMRETNKDGKEFLPVDAAEALFMKPVLLDIKTQCEIAE